MAQLAAGILLVPPLGRQTMHRLSISGAVGPQKVSINPEPDRLIGFVSRHPPIKLN